MNSDLLFHVVAAAVPFAICFGVARAGHVRTAWWLPGGILAVTLAFVLLGLRLGTELETAAGAIQSILILGLPAALAGVAGIFLGRRRA